MSAKHGAPEYHDITHRFYAGRWDGTGWDPDVHTGRTEVNSVERRREPSHRSGPRWTPATEAARTRFTDDEYAKVLEHLS